MMNSSIRLLFALAGAALLAASALPAAAATLTYNDPNCAGFQITGGGGSFTLTCAKIQCSISGNINPTTTQDTTLTANCSPTPSGYVWRLLTGPFSHPTCNAPVPQPDPKQALIPKPTGIVAGDTRACLYQVDATAAPLAGQSMVTVTWNDAVIVAPSGCSLNANPSTLPLGGGNVTLTATCSGGGAPTSYAWTGPGVVTPTTTNQQIVNVTASTAFFVTPSNSGGPGNTATAPVTVSSGGGPVSCGAPFAKTVFIDIGYPASGTFWHTQDYGGFNSNDALVVKITVPAGVQSSFQQAGSISTVEYIDPAANRYATLSTNPCDWSGTLGYTIPVLWTNVQGIAPSLQVGRKDFSSMVQLNAGTVYYLNMKNTAADGVTPTCSGGCNININWTRPPGT